jgi:hypothetical protein
MAAVYCMKCGTENPTDRRTCQSCFSLLRQPVGQDARACRGCGTQSPGDAAYCASCGAPFGQGVNAPQAAFIPGGPGAGTGGPHVGAPGGAPPGVAPARDPLADRRPWDYRPEDRPPELAREVEMGLASRIIMGLGGAWLVLGAVVSISTCLLPVIVFKCELDVSAAMNYGAIVVCHLLTQVWLLIDILDRGSPRWWLAVSFLVPMVGLWLYILLERSDA